MMAAPTGNLEPRSGGAPAQGAPLFVASGLCKSFGALNAIEDLSFEVKDREIFGIAGPNGAGKSTLLNLCTGMLVPSDGQLVFGGSPVAGWAPHRLCRDGIARTFQIPTIFESLTVRENVETGVMFGLDRKEGGGTSRRDTVEYALRATGLESRAGQRAGTLSLLGRKMIMLAAALATHPRMLFMDEPLGGLTVDEVDQFMATIQKLHDDFGITFVIVEHKIRALTELSDRLMIMHYGRLLCLDRPEVVVRNEQVVRFYLGSENYA